LSGEPDLEIVSSDLTFAVAEAVAATGRASIVPREKTSPSSSIARGSRRRRDPEADYVIAGSLDQTDAGSWSTPISSGRPDAGALGRAPPMEASERSSIASDLARRIRERLSRPN
jgi:hypothetical protein